MIDPRLIPVVNAHEMLTDILPAFADSPSIYRAIAEAVRMLGKIPAPELEPLYGACKTAY